MEYTELYYLGDSRKLIDAYDVDIEKSASGADFHGYPWKVRGTLDQSCELEELPSPSSSTQRHSTVDFSPSLESEGVPATRLERPGKRWVIRAQIPVVVSLFVVLIVLVVISDLRSTAQRVSSVVGFQPGAERRSTMDIIYSCLTTMVICIVSAIHFDLPDSKDRFINIWDEIEPDDFWKRNVEKVVAWVIGVLIPEAVLAKACAEYYKALVDCAYMKTKQPEWTLKQSFFAKMEGFTLEAGDQVTSGRELLKRGAKLDDDICRRLEREISDKSKADVLTKSLAIIQITRFLLEIIARVAHSLPVSPLEYFTCAQVFCALLMYIFWFDKPHGVQEKIRLDMGRQNEIYDGCALDIHDNYRPICAGLGVAIMIGASALASWNVPFSDPTLQSLWRAISLASVVLPLTTVGIACLTSCVDDGTRKDNYAVWGVTISIFHCLVRTVVVIFIFYSFRNLPSGVYDTESWLDFIPFFH